MEDCESSRHSGTSYHGMSSVKLIPRFDGSGDVDAWLCRAELIVEARNENPASVIPVCLDGAAFAVYEQIDTEHRKDFTCLRDALIRAFGLSVYDAFGAFSDRRLQVGESVEVYAIAIKRLGRQCGITNDTALACKFVSGLPMDVCEKVKLSVGRAPTLDDAITAAQVLLTNTRKMIDGLSSETVQSADCSRVRKCFTCGKIGHVSARCRSRMCFNCGRDGHFARACPNNQASGNGKGKIVPSLPQSNLPDGQQ